MHTAERIITLYQRLASGYIGDNNLTYLYTGILYAQM
jgi:hypothetical protein